MPIRLISPTSWSAPITMNSAMKNSNVVQSTTCRISSTSARTTTSVAAPPIMAVTAGVRWNRSPKMKSSSVIRNTTPALRRMAGSVMRACSFRSASRDSESGPWPPSYGRRKTQST